MNQTTNCNTTTRGKCLSIVIPLTAWLAVMMASAVQAQMTSPAQQEQPAPQTVPSFDFDSVQEGGGGLENVAAGSMDWLARQIAPPSGEGEQAGWAVLSDPNTKRSAIKTGATLTLVISVFLLLVFVLRMRPSNKRRRGGLPDDVVAVIGQTKFGQTQRLQLIRLGSKLLLVSSSSAGSHTLGEITDPEEVYQIETMCREGKFNSLSETLRRRAAESAVERRQSGVSLGGGQTRARSGRTLLEA